MMLNTIFVVLVLSATVWSATIPATSDACAGIDIFPDSFDDLIADADLCGAVDAVKGVNAAARCAALSPFGFGTPKSLFSTNADEHCAVGIELGRIAAGQLSASSTQEDCMDKEKWRLNAIDGTGEWWAGGWCSDTRTDQWLQVDFGHSTVVSGIITQGRDDTKHGNTQWTKSFQIMYSTQEDGGNMEYIRDDSGQIQTFQGNSDAGTHVQNIFSAPITARVIRIMHVSWKGRPAMRFELMKPCAGHPSDFFCSLITDVIGMGLLIPDEFCTRIMGEIVVPIMDEDIETDAIAATVTPQLEGMVEQMIDASSEAADAMSDFIDSFNVCLPVNLNPNYWKAQVEKLVALFKTMKQGKEHGEQMLQGMKDLVKDCRTYSVIFTLDIEALAILGKEVGLYLTFNVEGGFRVTEAGIVDGVSANYGLDRDIDVSAGVTVAIQFGDMSAEEWGYAVELGASIPVAGVGVGLSGGLLFSADPVTKALGNFNGVSMTLSGSFGESSLTVDFDASISCGFSTAKSFAETFQPEQADCVAAQGGQTYDELIAPLQESLDRAQEVLESKWDELKRCGKLYACEAKRCVYNFTPDNFRDCTDMANVCSDQMEECLTWEHKCEKKRVEVGCAKDTCHDVVKEVRCKNYENNCEDIQEKAGCKHEDCHEETTKTCQEIDCGIFNFLCGGVRVVCKKVTKTVCNGCKEWNYTVKKVCLDVCEEWEYVVEKVCDGVCDAVDVIITEVVEPVYTVLNCAAESAVEVVEKFRCVKYLPNCLESGMCYVGKATAAPVECATGMIAPSEECLENNGFI